MDSIRLRPAQAADVPEMVAVFFSAFQDSAVNERCFPESHPDSHTYHASRIHGHLAETASHVIVAEEGEEAEEQAKHPAEPPPPIAGWARWVRRPCPHSRPEHPPQPGEKDEEKPPEPEFKAEMYPDGGDGEFAARFFRANYAATRRIVGDEDHWFLSMMVVRQSFQRRGVGRELTRYGTDKADGEGWAAYVNGSVEARALYERAGFEVVEVTEFDAGIKSVHMKREAGGKTAA